MYIWVLVDSLKHIKHNQTQSTQQVHTHTSTQVHGHHTYTHTLSLSLPLNHTYMHTHTHTDKHTFNLKSEDEKFMDYHRLLPLHLTGIFMVLRNIYSVQKNKNKKHTSKPWHTFQKFSSSEFPRQNSEGLYKYKNVAYALFFLSFFLFLTHLCLVSAFGCSACWVYFCTLHSPISDMNFSISVMERMCIQTKVWFTNEWGF